MTEPRDIQPHDPFGSPPGPPPHNPPTNPPTSPGSPPHPPSAPGSQPAGWTPQVGDEHEYFVHSPQPPTSFRDAPDPFGGAPAGAPLPGSAEGAQREGTAKRWIVPIAALVVLVVAAAAVYLLFLSDSGDQKADGPTPTNAPTESAGADSGAESPESGSSGSDVSSSGGATPVIAGTFEVNGTVQSYSGPPTGQLGGAPKTAGAPAFTAAQTWVIDDCTDTSCELTVEQGGMTVTLELADGTWSGETTGQIACKPTVNAISDATITIEIPEEGGTATRTLSAQCDQPLEEVDALTLTPQ